MHSHAIPLAVAAVLVTGAAVPAGAQQVIVYPAKGQSPQQQQRDHGDCHVWAKQTGKIAIALASREGVFVLFGACTAPSPTGYGGNAAAAGETAFRTPWA